MLLRPYDKYAEKKYDNFTITEEKKLTKKFKAEAEAQGLKAKKKNDYVSLKCNPFKEDRKNQRDAATKELAEKLKTEIPEAIQKCKTPHDLETCADDIS